MPANQTISTADRDTRLPLWVKGTAALGATLLAAGAVIAWLKPGMLISPHEQVTEGVRVYAGYLTSRNAALALMLVAGLTLRARAILAYMLVLVGSIQIFDACIDAVEGRWQLIPGIGALGIIFLLAAATVFRSLGREAGVARAAE